MERICLIAEGSSFITQINSSRLVQSRLIDVRYVSGSAREARIIANFRGRDRKGKVEGDERSPGTAAFVSPLQRRVACEGMDVARVGDKEGGL